MLAHTVRNHLQAAMKRLRQSLDAQHLSTLGLATRTPVIDDYFNILQTS